MSKTRSLAGALLVASAAPAAAEPLAEPLAGPAVAAGEETRHHPVHRTRLGSFVLEFPASAQLGANTVGAVPADAEGNTVERSAVTETVLRVGARFDSETRLLPLVVKAEGEYDLLAGAVSGGRDPLVDDRLLGPEEADGILRKAYLRLGFAPFLVLTGGYTLNHWGLGLVANDGAQSRVLGEAGLLAPRVGDRVLRAQASTGPWFGRLLLSVAWDRVEDDDITLAGDEATQMVGAVLWGYDRPNRIGLYAARRDQEANDGDETHATALDLYARGELGLECGELTGELEAAYITGETELGPTVDHREHDIEQLGAAARLGFDADRWGALTDLVYASGDSNFDDGEQHAFRADPGFQQGFVLFRHVLASQTARAPETAADPSLVGLPSEDLDRIPTRGQVTNTWSFAPRLFVRPTRGLTAFGGALVALTDTPLADPRESRLAGGTPHNALGGEPSSYLGTELSLGARHESLLFGTRLTAAVEGALFLPGGAFDDAAGQSMDNVAGARLTARWEL